MCAYVLLVCKWGHRVGHETATVLPILVSILRRDRLLHHLLLDVLHLLIGVKKAVLGKNLLARLDRKRFAGSLRCFLNFDL